MSFENPHQEGLSEDQFGQTNEFLLNKNKKEYVKDNLNTDPIIKQYEEKLTELIPIELILKNYIEAKENIDQTQFNFDRMRTGSVHVDHETLQKTMQKLNQYKQSIESYEQENNALSEKGLVKEKQKLAQLEIEINNLRELKFEFDEEKRKYKQN